MAAAKGGKEVPFVWEGVDAKGRKFKGNMLAMSEAIVRQSLRKQGINATKIRKQGALARTRKITEKDIALFSRQLATMVKAGVPLLQAFDITAKSHSNPSVQRLLGEIKTDVESGSALHQALRKHPKYFDNLFCNLVEAGEQAGILESVLDRIAGYKEKILAIKGKIKSALMYPAIVLVIAFLITAGIMIFVIPAFAEMFRQAGSDLPILTQMVMKASDFFVESWHLLFGFTGALVFTIYQAYKRSLAFRAWVDKVSLKLPVFGPLIEKAAISRWARTFSAMFSAGVPLVDSLGNVAGAAGNYVFAKATEKVRADVTTGSSLASSLRAAGIFPSMLVQMVGIGEESGSLDAMVDKVADFFEREVDAAVDGLTSLIEPLIMVFLGGLIGTIVIAMYLPIFKLAGSV